MVKWSNDQVCNFLRNHDSIRNDADRIVAAFKQNGVDGEALIIMIDEENKDRERHLGMMGLPLVPLMKLGKILSDYRINN